MDYLRYWWGKLRSSFWFLPTCLVLASMLLGITVVEIDRRVEVNLAARSPHLFAISAEGAQGLLQAIATSMITVAGVIFSITILILNEASNQYSPRILRNFVRDRSNQIVLGVFLAIFVYCVIVLRSIHDVDEGKFVPPLAVLGSIGLALGGIGVLIFFIHHIAYSIQASTILQRATNETLAEIQHLYPEELAGGSDEHPAELPPEARDEGKWHGVKARRSGYLEVASPDDLIQFAVENDTILRLDYRIGDFVVEDTILVSVYGKQPLPAKKIRELTEALSISPYRTIEQDASFGIRQLVDIALKALSPSMNDTTTAVMSVDHLTTILARLIQRRLESPYRIKDGHLRVIAPRPGFEDLLNNCFEQIRQNAAGNVAMLDRLIHSLDTVIPLTGNRTRLDAIGRQLDLVRKTIESNVTFPHDRSRLLLACDRTADRLQSPNGNPPPQGERQ